jgi:hypothetical protein
MILVGHAAARRKASPKRKRLAFCSRSCRRKKTNENRRTSPIFLILMCIDRARFLPQSTQKRMTLIRRILDDFPGGSAMVRSIRFIRVLFCVRRESGAPKGMRRYFRPALTSQLACRINVLIED